MNTYQQIHDFTASGAAKFLAFFDAYARAGIDPSHHRLECLGVMEDNLNGDCPEPFAWELDLHSSTDGRAHVFTAERDDLIIEHVTPDE